jgi:Mor family transcriptional regulator
MDLITITESNNILYASFNGESVESIADRFNISQSIVQKHIDEFRERIMGVYSRRD